MQVKEELCVGCGRCVLYCPVQAISLSADRKLAVIDQDECVECGACLRSPACKTGALYQPELTWPRAVRSLLSDPLTIAPESGISGRGTEEMKTNDVTARFKRGYAGVAVEVGRPLLGARLRDVEKVAQAIARFGVEFEKINPTTSLMADPKTGKFKDDLLDEKVLSAIIEFAVPIEKLPDVLYTLERVSHEIDTIFTVDVCSRCNPDGSIPHEELLARGNWWYSINVKTNVGLGRPLAAE
ncbi:MAG: 4Fe-4S binding protein [Firmicutes bacterium]|jgi:NAD-dependent dihydropyrimidine dehydrogenase PreA subunit|nr:4Fe-4S binding protein [Bacillota bacterium]